MLRFVTDHVGGVGSKRKQAPKSCEPCKKRHKRCRHNEQSVPDTEPIPVGSGEFPEQQAISFSKDNVEPSASAFESSSHLSDSMPAVSSLEIPKAGPADPKHSSSRDTHLRFVGDLSPEASLLVNRMTKEGAQSVSRHDYVGVWLDQKSERPTRRDIHERSQPGQSTAESRANDRAPLLERLRPALSQECLTTVPPDAEYARLSSIYYVKINPIFPVLHAEALDQHGEMEAVALKQCICLVASMDPSSRKYLRLQNTEGLLSQIEFRDRMAAAIKQSLDMGFLGDNMVILQVSVLMAFHVDRPGCSELSSYYCAQAVNLAQTLGLHLGWPSENDRIEKSKRIFWCVWVLDRLNAAANGRPIIIHERDMDQTIQASADSQQPAFKLLILITRYLDQTISFYRPHADFPGADAVSNTSFEDMVEEAGALEIGNALLASLELLYLSVVILHSRPKAKKDYNGTRSSELQIFGATSIVSIASQEFKDTVSFWPIVPYSVSLATSIAYKSLRNSITAASRRRAYTLFQNGCEVLDELSKAFVSARAVAKLAMDTLQEMERVTAERRRNQFAHSGAASSEEQSQDTSQVEDMTHFQEGQQSTSAARQTPRMLLEASESSRSSLRPLPALSDGLMFSDEYGLTQFEGEAGIFTDFDPSFDLNRLDALFSSNLDPTVPVISAEWFDAS
ncbi:unnamed protein product [Clonostachys rosea]|uniref:Xylanolytic transcriptional activator regulatory domain-containing protein n=1 Tax=Bionectria ochroleuca TaxID=29856 RepID=A0ABY6URY1_BIOOC|nr:unnamed protein product [Clonostachys rosea]